MTVDDFLAVISELLVVDADENLIKEVSMPCEIDGDRGLKVRLSGGDYFVVKVRRLNDYDKQNRPDS